MYSKIQFAEKRTIGERKAITGEKTIDVDIPGLEDYLISEGNVRYEYDDEEDLTYWSVEDVVSHLCTETTARKLFRDLAKGSGIFRHIHVEYIDYPYNQREKISKAYIKDEFLVSLVSKLPGKRAKEVRTRFGLHLGTVDDAFMVMTIAADTGDIDTFEHAARYYYTLMRESDALSAAMDTIAYMRFDRLFKLWSLGVKHEIDQLNPSADLAHKRLFRYLWDNSPSEMKVVSFVSWSDLYRETVDDVGILLWYGCTGMNYPPSAPVIPVEQ